MSCCQHLPKRSKALRLFHFSFAKEVRESLTLAACLASSLLQQKRLCLQWTMSV